MLLKNPGKTLISYGSEDIHDIEVIRRHVENMKNYKNCNDQPNQIKDKEKKQSRAYLLQESNNSLSI